MSTRRHGCLWTFAALAVGAFLVACWWQDSTYQLGRYGVYYKIEESGGMSGSYQWVSFTRKWRGRDVSGPSVGGSYPRVKILKDSDGPPLIIVEDAGGHQHVTFRLMFPKDDASPLFEVVERDGMSIDYAALNLFSS